MQKLNRKMKTKLLVAFTFILSLFSTNVWAWGTTGHRVVAEIAERNLTNKAKKNLQKVIGNQKLAYFANYPDFVKSDPRFKDNDGWHYVNLEADLNQEQCFTALEASTEKNLYKRALLLMDELENSPSLSMEKKQEMIYYLIHMIGDAHQPLHVGRPGDLGGNKVKVEWFGQPTNIHAVWDGKLVDYEKYSYTEYAEVLDVLTKKDKKSVQQGELKHWLFDSHILANEIYADAASREDLRYEYHYKYKKMVEDQMMKAGLRLAKVLNVIYG